MPDLRELCAPPAPDLAGLPVFDLMFEDDDWLDIGPFPLLSTPFFTVDDMMAVSPSDVRQLVFEPDF